MQFGFLKCSTFVTFFQYNKSKGKAHPFETCGTLDWDVIKEKVTKLKERAATDLTFAAALARESGEDAAKIKFGAAVKLNTVTGVPSFDEERNTRKLTSEVFADSRLASFSISFFFYEVLECFWSKIVIKKNLSILWDHCFNH